MSNYLLSLIPTPKSGDSIDRLRAVYTDLLRHIDLDNDHLGQRRGIDDEDAKCHRKSSRFSFRRSVIPSPKGKSKNSSEDIDDSAKTKEDSTNSTNSELVYANTNPLINPIGVVNNKVDLATAFRILAATKSPDKEGENYGAVAIRDESSVCGIQRAKALENRVIELISKIGEIVVDAGGDGGKDGDEILLSVRTDPVFEYFCEKCILSLFVEIAREVRQGRNHPLESPSRSKKPPKSLSVRGVVWSGTVKAQVYRTVALLVSDRNQTVIHYLLSNNYMNELIKCILPLQQWTEQALSQMLPPYVELLKNLTLQIADDPHLFPFLTIENEYVPDSDDLEDASLTRNIEFPLFTAALETATSVYAQSDSQTYATCLAIIVNLMQISHKPIQTWICQSNVSQKLLADHLCQRLLDRYYRMANLTRGPVVNGIRHNAIASQLVGLRDEMGMVHEIFWSGVRGMDVRLCESLLQRVVFVLLKNLVQTPPARQFFIVGLIDADVIPEPEASAQVATIFFSYMFSNLVYVPFQRMLSVALFHQNSTPIWSRPKLITNPAESIGGYLLMPALSDIVNNEDSVETCLNPFRREIFKTLEGEYGEWRTIATACMLQSVLNTDAMDTDAVVMSGLISSDGSVSSLDHSIAKFLSRSHKPSAISIKALECIGYLGLMILHRGVMNDIREEDKTEESIRCYLSKSPIWNALKDSHDHFCRQAMAFRNVTGVSDIFLDLTEAVIKNRYTARFSESGSAAFMCHLSRRGCFSNMIEADFLVRKNRCVGKNEVETARFFIKMGIHFRALCKIVNQFSFGNETERETLSAFKETKQKEEFDFVDIADSLTRTIGGLSDKAKTGAAIDLTGRMFFRFQPALNRAKAQSLESSSEGAINEFNSISHLTLVLDPTDLFIVKPMVQKMEENRGTILFGISLRNIIAAAVDQSWLHIAIRNPDKITDKTLIKNGNMAFQFESTGTCLIVKQYLDRSREVLRQDLLNKVPDLLQVGEENDPNDSCVC